MKIYILFLAILTIGFSASGQRQKNKDNQKLKEELNLTEAQADSIKKIRKPHTTGKKALNRRQRMEQAGNRAQRKALHEQRKEAIEDVLTDEQEDQWKDYRERKHAETRKAKLDELKGQLNVSPAQAAQLDSANNKFMESAKQLSADEEATKTKMKDLRKEFRSEIQAILTPEQFERWQELRKMKRAKHPKK
ncbi:MAG TPA: hypothetical protein VD927_09175 [Chryseosolibacter sp.]|nr:hypothetical protein [Chryseosolibacter sp.]